MILASKNGNLTACKLIRETPKAWIVDYCDQKYPGEKRINKDGERQCFNTVDEALEWMGINLA